MKKVITYGTFDLFHVGHENLLRRAKALGDYLIVGVTSEQYDRERGKLNVHQSLMQRIKNVEQSGFADQIIIEEHEAQKIEDIVKYGVNVFAIGSDWVGRFDYLKEYCDVVYLERTKNISSTELRNSNGHMVNLGLIGCGRIANRFISESKYVSGVNICGVYNPDPKEAQNFAKKHSLEFCSSDFNDFIKQVDAVYIATPHQFHADYIHRCLENGLHVLCEKPMTLKEADAKELFMVAKAKNLVLMEAVKTAYAPGFIRLIALVKSGAIGEIRDVDAAFTMLRKGNLRELDVNNAGGSMNELASYVMLPIMRVFGTEYEKVEFFPYFTNGIDSFTRGVLEFSKGTASFKVGLGVKTEGELLISGTSGYAYVPAPWWKTEYFELRFEDANATRKYFYKFEGDGLRYELNEFVRAITLDDPTAKRCLSEEQTIATIGVIDKFNSEFQTRN